MKRFFHTLVTLLLLAACTDGNNELGSKDPFSIPDKEGCNVREPSSTITEPRSKELS